MQLLDRKTTLDDEGRSASFLLILTRGDREMVKLALKSVRGEIDAEEFRTRLGVPTADADALLASLANEELEHKTARRPPGTTPISTREQADERVVPFTESQLLLVNNALNETLHGIAPEYVAPGLHTADAEALLNTIGTNLDEGYDSPPNRAGKRGYIPNIR